MADASVGSRSEIWDVVWMGGVARDPPTERVGGENYYARCVGFL